MKSSYGGRATCLHTSSINSRSSLPFSRLGPFTSLPVSSSNDTRFFLPPFADPLDETPGRRPRRRITATARSTYGRPISRNAFTAWFVTVIANIWSCSRVGLSFLRALMTSISQKLRPAVLFLLLTVAVAVTNFAVAREGSAE